MSIATEVNQPTPPKPPEKPTEPAAVEPVLGVTRYDRVTSLLLTLILVLGIGMVAFGAVWTSNHTWIVHRPPAKVQVVDVIEDVAGGGEETGVLGESLYAPGPEGPEISSAVNPDDIVSDSPDLEQSVKAVMDVVGAMQIADQLMTTSDLGSSSIQYGNPKGKGRHRALGKGPGDGGGVKRQERWEILYDQGQTEAEYARQLDFFGIELGAIVEGKMYMVSQLSSSKPAVRPAVTGPQEKRLYFSWRGGSRRQVDLSLLRKAGVALSGNVIVLQFYPQATEQILAHLERDYLVKAKGTDKLEYVRKTKFALKKVGARYEFEITRQEYLGQPASQ